MNYYHCMKCGERVEKVYNSYIYIDELKRYTRKICYDCLDNVLNDSEWAEEIRTSRYGKFGEKGAIDGFIQKSQYESS